MRWECTKAEGDNYRFNLNFYCQKKWDAQEYLHGTVYYQGWGFGACSTNFLWHWYYIPNEASCEESLASFIEAYRQATSGSSWNAHMFMCQIPEGNNDYPEAPFFKYFRETIYPDIQPVYTYPNRAHLSPTQRLYYFDTDIMFAWQGAYYDKRKQAEETAARSSDGTIINSGVGKPHPEQQQNGVQIKQYFDLFR